MSSKPVYNSDGSYNYAYSLFHEEPSKNLAYLACGVFALLFIAHLVQAIRFRTSYMVPLILGVLFEAAGYGARIPAIDNPFNIGAYSGQSSLIIISPVLIAASQYVMMEKIMHFVDAAASPVRPSLIAKIFVTSDIISFLVQGSGSGILVSSPALYNMGNYILIGGLVIQVVFYTAFLLISYVFCSRVKGVASSNSGWKKLYLALFTSCVLVLIRSIFRVIEFAAGFDGPIATNEKYMYTFDFALVTIAVVILNVYHPGVYLKTIQKDADVEMAPSPAVGELLPFARGGTPKDFSKFAG
ncbi:hypothetical protein HDU83_009490 [Entophlyctis luteolus]|nr:hypothetical protein HDU83_009490 [Entophlyctis luteolus]